MYIKLPKEQKDEIKSKIQNFFLDEHGEEIGELAADNALNFFMRELGPYIYNQGISDAKSMVEQKVMNLDEDLTSLERPINLTRR